jgi:hypothetical protein
VTRWHGLGTAQSRSIRLGLISEPGHEIHAPRARLSAHVAHHCAVAHREDYAIMVKSWFFLRTSEPVFHLTTAPYQTAYNTKHIATKYNDAKSWLGRGGRGEKETGCNFYTRFSPQPYFGLSIRLSHFKTTL